MKVYSKIWTTCSVSEELYLTRSVHYQVVRVQLIRFLLDLIQLCRNHVTCHYKRAIGAKPIAFHQSGNVNVIADINIWLIRQVDCARVKIKSYGVSTIVPVPLEQPRSKERFSRPCG